MEDTPINHAHDEPGSPPELAFDSNLAQFNSRLQQLDSTDKAVEGVQTQLVDPMEDTEREILTAQLAADMSESTDTLFNTDFFSGGGDL